MKSQNRTISQTINLNISFWMIYRPHLQLFSSSKNYKFTFYVKFSMNQICYGQTFNTFFLFSASNDIAWEGWQFITTMLYIKTTLSWNIFFIIFQNSIESGDFNLLWLVYHISVSDIGVYCWHLTLSGLSKNGRFKCHHSICKVAPNFPVKIDSLVQKKEVWSIQKGAHRLRPRRSRPTRCQEGV